MTAGVLRRWDGTAWQLVGTLASTSGVPAVPAASLDFDARFRTDRNLAAQPVANNCWLGPGAFTTGNTGTFRSRHTALVDCCDLRAVFVNWYVANPSYEGQDTDGPFAMSIAAAWDVGGTVYPMTFGGSLTGSISPGGIVQSDPLGIEVTAGTAVYVRTYQPTGGYYPTVTASGAGCGGFTATSNLTSTGSAAIPDASSVVNGYGPSAVLGTPRVRVTPSVAVLGDSIPSGTGDVYLGTAQAGYTEWAPGGLPAGGFISRALTAGGVPHLSVTHSGDKAHNFTSAFNRFRRAALVSGCTHAICQYGVNDFYFGGQSTAQVQASLITIWSLLAERGMITWQTTITPSTTSTDGWVTTVNQAPTASIGTNRTAFNDWLRGGAPVASASNLTAVAVGTSGALLAGQPGHPLAGYFEIADLAESARNSGLWNVSGVRTVSDAAITSAGTTLTSATANFTSADVGKGVYIAGAGTAGAGLGTLVNSVASGTQATVNTAASTTVSGASAGIGVPTVDGTHPTSAGHAAWAAGIVTSSLVLPF